MTQLHRSQLLGANTGILIYENSRELPQHLGPEELRQAGHPAPPNYPQLVESGIHWLCEAFEGQPLARDTILKQGGKLIVAEARFKDDFSPTGVNFNVYLLLDLNGVCFPIEAWPSERSIEEMGHRSIFFGRYKCLPSGIARAYYSRIAGLEVVDDLIAYTQTSRILPARMTVWAALERTFRGRGDRRDLMLDCMKRLASLNGGVDSDLSNRFMVVVDPRRPGTVEHKGDTIFVDKNSENRNMFIVRNGDFSEVRTMISPDRTMDEYVTRVLSGSADDFDFLSRGERI